MRLLIASGNQGKIKEMEQLLTDLMHWEILSLADLATMWTKEKVGGLPPLRGEESQMQTAIQSRYATLNARMEESGSTIEENARLKALGAAGYTGMLSLADDSGIEVDYLQGAPGVYSARYAGSQGDDQANNTLLLRNMQNAPEENRHARFRAVVVLANQDKVLYTATGVWEGSIGFAPHGDGGFGYDPLFIPRGDKRTSAELSPEEKNQLSHRGQAMRQMAKWLRMNQEAIGRGVYQ